MHLIIITLAALLGLGTLSPSLPTGSKAPGYAKTTGGSTVSSPPRARTPLDVQPGGGPS